MKKFRNIILAFIMLIVGVFVGACTTTALAEQTYPLKIWAQNDNGDYHTLCVVDDDTGVNYVVVSTERGGGHRSIAITPRLNSDGTIYTNK